MKTNDSTMIWHERLGHVKIDKLKAMVARGLVKGLPSLSSFGDGHVCEGCQFGKAHCLSFNKSLSRCKVSLEFILSDLMGPCVTPTYSGYWYMLVLVDDFFSIHVGVFCEREVGGLREVRGVQGKSGRRAELTN